MRLTDPRPCPQTNPSSESGRMPRDYAINPSKISTLVYGGAGVTLAANLASQAHDVQFPSLLPEHRRREHGPGDRQARTPALALAAGGRRGDRGGRSADRLAAARRPFHRREGRRDPDG